MGKRKICLEDLLKKDTCGACGRGFLTTQGLSAHQSMSKTCAWYKKGKLKEMFDLDDLQGPGIPDNVVVQPIQYVAASYRYILLIAVVHLDESPIHMATLMPKNMTGKYKDSHGRGERMRRRRRRRRRRRESYPQCMILWRYAHLARRGLAHLAPSPKETEDHRLEYQSWWTTMTTSRI